MTTDGVVPLDEARRQQKQRPADPDTSTAIHTSETVEETYFETIQRLAALSTHEYERCRKAEAKRLDMRANVLDKEVSSARPKDKEGNDLGLTDLTGKAAGNHCPENV